MNKENFKNDIVINPGAIVEKHESSSDSGIIWSYLSKVVKGSIRLLTPANGEIWWPFESKYYEDFFDDTPTISIEAKKLTEYWIEAIEKITKKA